MVALNTTNQPIITKVCQTKRSHAEITASRTCTYSPKSKPYVSELRRGRKSPSDADDRLLHFWDILVNN